MKCPHCRANNLNPGKHCYKCRQLMEGKKVTKKKKTEKKTDTKPEVKTERKSRLVMTAEGMAKYDAAVRVIKQARSALTEIEWDDSVPGMKQSDKAVEIACAKLAYAVTDYETHRKSFEVAEDKRIAKVNAQMVKDDAERASLQERWKELGGRDLDKDAPEDNQDG